jgi:hypothetical protein
MKITILEQNWQNQETPEQPNSYAENIMSKILYTPFLLIKFHGKTIAVLSKKKDSIYPVSCFENIHAAGTTTIEN